MTAGFDNNTGWVRRFHPKPEPTARLVCLPHAGGAATFFFRFSLNLPPTIEALPIQYPGRQDRRLEPCVDDLNELADHVTRELLPWTDRPLAIFGHSMGAAVGFEVAKRLEQLGVPALGLLASGHRAPSRHRAGTVHHRDDEALIEAIAALDGTKPQLLDDELLRMALPMIRSDYRAVETYRYRPGPPLSCPIAGLTGDRDPLATLDEMRSWADHTSAGFDLTVFPGGHFYLINHAAAVVRTVSQIVAAWASSRV